MSRSRLTLALAAGVAGAVAVRRYDSEPVLDARVLSGRTAVVTGAGSGIGRALAELLAERGATVCLVDLDGPAVDVVADAITAAGGRAHAHTLDVADAAAVQQLADELFAAGPVDLLFNNAGIGHAGAVVDTPLEDWRRLVEVNLMGVVHGVHAFLPRLVAQGRPAHVVNTASLAGLVPVPGLVPYATTKAALVGLSHSLDVELRGTGVRVSALCPGVIDTPIVGRATMRGSFAARQQSTAQRYARRGASPEVVARQALDGVTRGAPIVLTPRIQVGGAWGLTRLSPALARSIARLSAAALVGRG